MTATTSIVYLPLRWRISPFGSSVAHDLIEHDAESSPSPEYAVNGNPNGIYFLLSREEAQKTRVFNNSKNIFE